MSLDSNIKVLAPAIRPVRQWADGLKRSDEEVLSELSKATHPLVIGSGKFPLGTVVCIGHARIVLIREVTAEDFTRSRGRRPTAGISYAFYEVSTD